LPVESRKLPSKLGKTTTPGSPFSDSQEPDSVIDLHMNNQTHTLQCFSVEEENRWISYLQVRLPHLDHHG
jgi:hypothetical protein